MKTNITELLNELFANGIKIWVEDGKLRCKAPDNVLTDTQFDRLKEQKEDIINHLTGKEDSFIEYPLSTAQQALWFIYRLAPENPVYNIGTAFRISSAFDETNLRNAFQALVNRHSAFRTTFFEKEGKILQRVHAYQKGSFNRIDASGWDEAKLCDEVQKALYRPFDLEKGPAIRMELFIRSDNNAVALFAAHHIVTDGTTFWLIYKEMEKLYRAEAANEPALLPRLKASFADHVKAEAEFLKSVESEALWEYWKNELSGDLPVLNLPTDHPRPPIQRYNGDTVFFDIDNELMQKLQKISQQKKSTLYMTLLAAFHILLHRYTGQDDIIVTSPTAGRADPEFSNTAGYFVNTIPIRADFSDHSSFEEFLNKEKKKVVEGFRREKYPFPLIVQRLGLRRDTACLPLVQASFALLKLQFEEGIDHISMLSPDESLNWAGITIHPFELREQEGEFDIFLQIMEKKKSMEGALKYNSDLFERNTIERMAEHFKMLLHGIVDNPAQRISEIPMLTKEEWHKILVEFNDTKREYPADKCVHHLFEEQVEKTPESVALVFEDKKLTYKELNERANRLANYLLSKGVGPEVFVGISIERSIEMIIGILGIIKAGGAYVPLDPDYPEERISFMIEDAGIKILLSQKKLSRKFPAYKGEIWFLDAESEISNAPETKPLSKAVPNNIAYMIYTSGSTGKPKGVAVPHRGVIRLLFGVDYVHLGPDETLLQLATISFDASTFEIWSALLHGGRCVIFPSQVPTNEDLGEVIDRYAVSTLFLTTSLFNMIISESPHVLRGIRQLLAGGEALSVPHIRQALEHLPSTQIINGYGPTEGTTFTCCYPIPRHLPEGINSIPIGPPIANTRVYVLDRHMAPVPVGVPGELYIGGDGLARGYLNRPELTAEKFILNPFDEDPESRLYKTGDLARWLPDGNIEYMGRIDFQVKIRGFRIELGEIETAISAYPGIKENIVIATEIRAGDKQLVAYIVTEKKGTENSQPDIGGLKSFLQEKLPDYMIPSFFVFRDSLPLNLNGKIDRKKLPAPKAAVTEDRDQMPQSETEKIIASIWKESLGIDHVGIYDNFFDIGGHSLLIAQVNQKLKKRLNKDLSISEMFQYPTIHALAQHISQSEKGNSISKKTDERAKKRIARRKSVNKRKTNKTS